MLYDPPEGRPEVILIGTGSEVSLCLEAARKLAEGGTRARVVSMPCWELFETQEQSYKDEVLPPDLLARVSVEQGATLGWERYVGMNGTIIGMRSFGASAPLVQAARQVRLHAREGDEGRRGPGGAHAEAAPGRRVTGDI